jgi:hypothetical protein
MSPFKPVILGAALLLSTASALADEIQCRGTLGASQYDNIFVPDGATCTLNRTRAKGSVVVGARSTLRATSVTINGNVQAEGARSVSIRGASMIGGSVQIVQGFDATVERAAIKGDLYLDDNTGPLLASTNRIGGNLQAFQNTGGVHLLTNTMGGNLQCKENSPPPTGGGNRASSKEDQCARL